jgi:hypothetical protein
MTEHQGFRDRVRRILVDRASLDEQIEEFFEEVLDDIVDAHHGAGAPPEQSWQRPLRTWPTPEPPPGVQLHLTYDDTGRALVHEAVLAQLLIDAGWERTR